MSLKVKITEDMKEAMRAKDVVRLGTIRLLQSAIKQREVDERIELTDQDVMAVIEKMLKQRRDSIEAYESAKRQDLADAEKAEVVILQSYLPQALSDEEVSAILDVEDPITNEYLLEVSSPGLDRPLFTPAHFAAVVGQKIEVKLAIPQDGRRKFKGVLTAIEDDMLIVEVDGKPFSLLMDNVDKANVVPVF